MVNGHAVGDLAAAGVHARRAMRTHTPLGRFLLIRHHVELFFAAAAARNLVARPEDPGRERWRGRARRRRVGRAGPGLARRCLPGPREQHGGLSFPVRRLLGRVLPLGFARRHPARRRRIQCHSNSSSVGEFLLQGRDTRRRTRSSMQHSGAGVLTRVLHVPCAVHSCPRRGAPCPVVIHAGAWAGNHAGGCCGQGRRNTPLRTLDQYTLTTLRRHDADISNKQSPHPDTAVGSGRVERRAAAGRPRVAAALLLAGRGRADNTQAGAGSLGEKPLATRHLALAKWAGRQNRKPREAPSALHTTYRPRGRRWQSATRFRAWMPRATARGTGAGREGPE